MSDDLIHLTLSRADAEKYRDSLSAWTTYWAYTSSYGSPDMSPLSSLWHALHVALNAAPAEDDIRLADRAPDAVCKARATVVDHPQPFEWPAEGPERAATGERQTEFASALGVPLDTLEDAIAECERKYEFWEVGHAIVRHDHFDKDGFSVNVPTNAGIVARVVDLGYGEYGFGETARAALRDAMRKSSERKDIAERRKQLALRAAGEGGGA